MQFAPEKSVASWSVGKTLVVLTFAGVAVVAVFVGPAKFIASFGFYLIAFPVLVVFASGTNSIPAIPGGLLVASFVLPVLWIVSLWFTGIRAWDRDSTGGG